jgi:hypothetical protein
VSNASRKSLEQYTSDADFGYSGDGRADIICLEQGGKLTSWLNKKGGLKDVGQIKLTEGW